MKYNVYAIRFYDSNGTVDDTFVAAKDAKEAEEVLKTNDYFFPYDVLWLDGATYEADAPCIIKARLCMNDGKII